MTLPQLTPMPPGPPPRVRPQSRWRWWHTLLALLALLVIAALGVAGYGYFLTRAPASTGGKPYTLEIKPGDTLAQAALRLEKAGVVRSPDALRLIMRGRGTAGRLREGYYDLPSGLTAFQVADRLADTPRPRVRNVTVPEGKRLRDLPGIMKAAQLGDADTFAATLKTDAGLKAEAGRCPGGSLEGFLFPATYPFRPEATNTEIVSAMRDRMRQEFTPERVNAAKRLGLDVCGWVTLASMVQDEAANTGEMPVIAGIFINRLKAGIALGSDPTVAYGQGKNLNQLDRSAGDFTKDTPYNTYTRRGLPYGPIDNPGAAALNSILNAKLTLANGRQALYFVHGLDGKIHVNADYASHLRDVNRYR